ncbi:cytochrome P450 [Actinomadura hibisca]|uniref:cytochrome P450 n=1 Tax=Actinomadura hibisca TaxID=68565 RepID=UPI000B002A74|nr:cytochrome P450 [Actinomadura hibisca]
MTITSHHSAASFVPRGHVLQVPLRRLLGTARKQGALGLIEGLGEQAAGELVQLKLGPFKPYLAYHPLHLEHLLRANAANWPRGAAMWDALGRLTGEGIGGEGAQWQASRRILQPAFAARHVKAMGEQMVASVSGAVQDLARRVEAGRPVDAGAEMTAIVQRVVDPVFFGQLIPDGEGGRLGAAVATAMRSLLWRMAMPGVPHWAPLPGDRRFHRSTRTIKQILGPVLTQARAQPADQQGRDVVSMLMNGLGADDAALTDEQIMQDIVALFVAGSESSAIALVWAWVALVQHPEVHAAVREEVDRVLGGGELRPEHIRRLPYTGKVVKEVLRLYSVAWAVPRIAVQDDEVGGVPVRAGSTLVISPYLTHRLPGYWPDPLRFDPERFDGDQVRARMALPGGPLAYLPFGDGAHACLGEGFFHQEATLVMAEMVRTFDIELAAPVQPSLSLTMQPRDPVGLLLTRR